MISPAPRMVRSERRWRSLSLTFLFAFGLGAVCASVLFIMIAAGPGSVAAASPAKQPDPKLVQAAQIIGIKRCLPAITATARRVTAGATRHDILIDWYRPAPDNGPSFSLTALEFGDQSVAFALAAVPGENNRCSLLAERISVAPMTCQAFAQAELNGYTGNSLLPSYTVYTSPVRPTETITTVANKTGCLVIRRQATFDWGVAR